MRKKPRLDPAEQARLDGIVAQFRVEFKCKEDGIEAIFSTLQREGVLVCDCGGCAGITREYGSYFFRCKSCGKKTWFLAGTFFARIRCPLAWLLAIRLFENGIVVNASELASLTGVAVSSAQMMLKKIMVAIQAKMPVESAVLPSAWLLDAVMRRTIRTPAQGHPKDEQFEFEKEYLLQEAKKAKSTDTTYSANVVALAQRIYDQLAREKNKLHFDHICGQDNFGLVSMATDYLQSAGLIKAMPGDWYIATTHEALDVRTAMTAANGLRGMYTEHAEKAILMVDALLAYLVGTYQGISRKYIQLYLSAYWYRLDESVRGRDSLFKHCCLAGPVTHHMLRIYVSPLMLKVMPIPEWAPIPQAQ